MDSSSSVAQWDKLHTNRFDSCIEAQEKLISLRTFEDIGHKYIANGRLLKISRGAVMVINKEERESTLSNSKRD